MSGEVSIVTSALRLEAKKWGRLSDQIAPISSAVKSLELHASAFFIGDMNVTIYPQVYSKYQQFMVTILQSAVTEFDQVGSALVKTADIFDQNEEIIEIDLNQIYSR